MASSAKFTKRGYTDWECLVCNKEGKVFHESDAGIEDVLTSMLAEHEKLSPKCDKDNVVLKNKALSLLLSL